MISHLKSNYLLGSIPVASIWATFENEVPTLSVPESEQCPEYCQLAIFPPNDFVYLKEPQSAPLEIELRIASAKLSDAVELAKQALACRVEATFQPETWVGDNAMELDGGRISFDALPALLRTDLSKLRNAFAEGVDFDWLADDLPARENHDGPFEVRLDEEDLCRLVHILTGQIEAFSDRGARIADIPDSLWDDFCAIASRIRAIRAHEEAPLQHCEIELHGNRFELRGTRGQGACQIRSAWKGGIPDTSDEQLARDMFEAQLLALYSSGALTARSIPEVPLRDGRFNAAVVSALEATLDATEGILDRDRGVGNDEIGSAPRARP
jgi:hypothetical protein